MHLPALSSDIVIILVIVIAGLYGMLGGAARARNLILSVYVGIVLAQTFEAILAPYAKGLSSQDLSLLLLGAPIIVFMVVHKAHSAKGEGLVNLIVGIAAGTLIIAAALHIIPPSSTSQITNGSFLAMEIETFSLWIIGLMPILAVVAGSLDKPKKRDHH